MSVYKRGDVWWYKFRFAGQVIRESSKSKSRTVARAAELARRRELEQSFNRIKKPRTAQLFSVGAEAWLQSKAAHLAPRSVVIERANLTQLSLFFGKLLLCDITGDDIARYQGARLKEGASPKTINLELGTVRAVLRKHRLWAAIQPDVRMLRAKDDVGRAITREEEAALLAVCRESRSRSLLPSVTLALNTAMRYSELRLLRWSNVNLAARTLTGRWKEAWEAAKRSALECSAASTICAIPPARGCSKPEHHFRLSPQSWVGAPLPRCEWRSGMATSGRPRSGLPLPPSAGPILRQMGHKIGHGFSPTYQRPALTD